MIRTRVRALAVAVAILAGGVVVLSGAAAATAQVEPTHGGVLRVGYDVEPPSWDVHQENSSEKALWLFVGDTLLRRDPVTGEIGPGLAERWTISEDKKTVTLFLRKGVKFHKRPPINGREMTADDVVYSLRRLTGKVIEGNFPRAGGFASVQGLRAVDRYTVELKLSQPFAPLITYLADSNNVVVPPEVDQFDGKLKNGANAVGTGPFVLKDFKPRIGGTLVRNPDYWMKGRPYLDGIEFFLIADEATKVAAYRARQVDVGSFTVGGLDAAQAGTLKRTNPEIQLVGVPVAYPTMFMMNVTKPPFDDERVRQAINLAIDRDQMVDIAMAGGGHVSSLVSWKLFPNYVLGPDDLKQMPGFRKPKDQDLARARQLLAEAGYANGLKIEADGNQQVAPWLNLKPTEVAKNQLRRIGIDINITLFDQTTFKDREISGDFGFRSRGSQTALEVDDQLYTRFHSKGPRNYGKVKDPELDRLIEAQQREFDPAKRRELVQAALRRLHDKAWYVPLFTAEIYGVAQPWVHGFHPSGDLYMGDVTQISFDQKKP